jgi:hypothetical protein
MVHKKITNSPEMTKISFRKSYVKILENQTREPIKYSCHLCQVLDLNRIT